MQIFSALGLNSFLLLYYCARNVSSSVNIYGSPAAPRVVAITTYQLKKDEMAEPRARICLTTIS